MTVESEVSRGPTFKSYLPAALAPPTAETAPPLAADLPRGRDELVLVVDDKFPIRHIAQETLEAFGYRVLTAGDGPRRSRSTAGTHRKSASCSWT
jgi:hypothetical protein